MVIGNDKIRINGATIKDILSDKTQNAAAEIKIAPEKPVKEYQSPRPGR